jgi:hypothetical protein
MPMLESAEHFGSIAPARRAVRSPDMRNRTSMILRHLAVPIAIAVLLLSVAAASAAPAKGHHLARRWHGYGFLPGYRTPERIESDEA